MRNLKRALSLTLASVMLLGMMIVGTSAASFPDVDDNDNVEAIEVLAAVNVIVGDNGNFKPDAPVTRNEMAVIMTKMLGLNANDFAGACPFTDVKPWAQNYVAACQANGIIAGRSATIFDGDATVTATEAAAMMMRALGYFKNPGDYEGGFVNATVRQAAQIRLFANVAGSANSPMNRNDVAQLALNTLEADMVDFTGTMGWEINGIAAGYQSKYEPRRDLNNNANGGKGYNYTNDQGTIATHQREYLQLLEELYDGKLTKKTNDTDNMAHTATTWSYKGKDIITTKNEADYAGYITNTNDTQAKLINYLNKNLVVVTGQVSGNTATYVNGVTGAWTPAVGDYMELYVNATNADKIDKIVVTHNTVTKLTANVTTRVNNSKDEVFVPGIVTTYTDVDNVVGYQNLAKDDIVLWHTTSSDASTADGYYIAKANSFTGILSASSAKEYTISGAKYEKSGVDRVMDTGRIDPKDFSKSDATWFVDDNNNIIWVQGEEASDVAYVIGIKDDTDDWDLGTVGVNDKLTAMLLFADNTVQTVTYENASGFIAAADTFVKYTVKDNVYTLSSAAADTVSAANGAAAAVKKGNPIVAFAAANANDVKTNSETIFFIRDYNTSTNKVKNSYTTYTGYANVPNIPETSPDGGQLTIVTGPTNAVTAVAYLNSNGYAKYVVINPKSDISGSEKASDMFYVVDKTVTTLYENGKASGYTIKAIKKGGDAIIDLEFKSNPSAAITANDKAYVIKSYNSDGQVTSFGNAASSFAANTAIADGEDVYLVNTNGTRKADDGSFGLGSATYGYTADTKVYFLDDKDNLTIKTVEMLEDDADDTYVAIRGHKDDDSKGAKTIVALFVRATGNAASSCVHDYQYTVDPNNAAQHIGTCTKCGNTESAAPHTPAGSKTRVDATDHKQACSDCGADVKENHSYGAWDPAKPTDCTQAYNHTKTCSGCGDEVTEEVSAGSHTGSSGSACTVCGKTIP